MRHESRRKAPLSRLGLSTTKGKILIMLCRGRQTVSELADGLGVSDNAVRAQLQRLQRDGLVAKGGSRRGVRRPHVEYELTPDAMDVFPRAYEPLVIQVVNVLTERLRAGASRGVLLEAGRRLLREHLGDVRGRTPRQRVAETMKRLNGSRLGIEVSEQSGKTVVRSCSCPIASVVAVQPGVCDLFARLLGEVLGAEVTQRCEKGEAARCRFEVMD
jgi:predicted ArsR family transcriptional regulator